jgi:hypothetical protein
MLDSDVFSGAASIDDDVLAFSMQLAAKLFRGEFVEEGMLNLSRSRHRLWHSEFTDYNKPLGHALTRRPAKEGRQSARPLVSIGGISA